LNEVIKTLRTLLGSQLMFTNNNSQLDIMSALLFVNNNSQLDIMSALLFVNNDSQT